MAVPSRGPTDSTAPSHPDPDRVIEIAIRDYKYVMHKGVAIRVETPMAITLRNEDNVTHGFVSAMFVDLPVQGEGGVPVSADGRAGFHVDPGQILTIGFTSDRLVTLDFQCDIHPNMKGEL